MHDEVGDDTLKITLGGNDTVLGGPGKDVIIADAAFTKDDKIDGGTSSDTLRLKGDYSSGVIFTSTTLANVEKIELASGFSYNLTLHDATVAAAGVLTIDGSTLLSGSSLMIDGSAEHDGQLVIQGGQGNDLLTGGALADTISGGAGNDTLNGGSGNDSLSGGDSNDLLAGGAGSDVLDGGPGVDIASYLTSSAGVTVDLATGTGAGGDAAGDKILTSGGVSTIETVIGSNFGDNITGEAQNNTLQGLKGNDTLRGGSGNDIVFGGDGNDVLDGGDGNDSLNGEAGNDLSKEDWATTCCQAATAMTSSMVVLRMTRWTAELVTIPS